MKRILIVDDSSVMRKNLRLILGREGYDVVAEAANGQEACRAYAEHQPDLVTMDITMPVMSGIEAVKAIIRSDPKARIMVISAFDQRSMVFEAMEYGAKHYIIKPITAEKLLQAVRQVLDRGPGQEEAGFSAEEEKAVRAAVKDPVAPVQGGFAVENRNGTFMMSLPGPDCAAHLPMAAQALQGLLFIKPLKIRFCFLGADRVEDAALDEIAGMIRRIRHAGGEAEVYADKMTLAELLRRWLPGIPVEGP